VTDPSKAVFLSYASQDAEAAQHLCNALRAAGIEVWFDQSELRGGDTWDALIRRQIKGCYLFVPMISANTQSREEGYFRREWKLAVDRTNDMAGGRAFLLPVVIDDTSDSEALVPEKFREVQWTRLPAGANTDAVVEQVRRLLSPDATTPAAPSVRSSVLPASSTDAAPARKSLPASRSFLPWIVSGVLILAAGYFVADKFLLSKHAVPADAAVSDKSIAVLPFADLSEKHDQEYFADGMAEEVMGLLAKIPQLKVISRTSAAQFKGRDVDVKTIGSTLGVRYVVEGSVRKSADRFRIAAELIDTRDGSQRWSETYDRGIEDTFKVQDAIAASLVRALELAVGGQEFPARSMPKNRAVYDLYLRGEQAYDRFDRQGFDQAAELYQQALDLDRTFAPAAIGLAEVLVAQPQWGYLAPKVGYEQARQAAELAIKLDPQASAPHQVLSEVHCQYDWDWSGAVNEADQAIALDSRNAAAHTAKALVLLSLGRLQEAETQLSLAASLDPLSPSVYFNRGWVLFWSGHLPEAEQSFRRALQISPTYESAHFYLGHVLLLRGDPAGALTQMQQEPDQGSRLAGIAAVQFAMGHRKESDAALDELTHLAAGDWASGIALVHAIRGETDAAFTWLDRAYALKDEDLYIIKGNPLLRNVVRDPRYTTFLRKMNLPE
jgi:TolB-like protein/thioredoxin-like negative regulator of GroEL